LVARFRLGFVVSDESSVFESAMNGSSNGGFKSGRVRGGDVGNHHPFCRESSERSADLFRLNRH